MKWKAMVHRLHSLPFLHRAMPVALAVGLFGGSWAYIFFAPPTYVSTAEVDFYNAASTQKTMVVDATVLAESILRPQVQETRMTWSAGPDQASRAWPSKTHVALSRISSSKLRLTLSGREPVSIEAASRALVSRLTGWSSAAECVGGGCAGKLEIASRTGVGPEMPEYAKVETGSLAEREIAMLRLTLQLLDAKIGETAARSQHKSERDYVSEPRRRLEIQRSIVSMRLAQELGEVKAPKPRQPGKVAELLENRVKEERSASERKAPVELAANNRQSVRVAANEAGTGTAFPAPQESFRLVSRDSGMAPAGESAPGILSIICLASLLVGSLYLAFALWWFRPVGGLQELQRLVPPQVRIFSSAGKGSQ